jgi:very-short-patch-repair endonuclease
MIRTIKPPLPSTTLDAAKSLRRAMTDAERRLWQYLRAGRLAGFKFRRQHPVPPYVVDFCCIEAALAVELDGSQHNALVDAERTRYLQAQGWRVVRYWNNEVLLQIDAVLEEIERSARSRTLSPTPLPEGEGL